MIRRALLAAVAAVFAALAVPAAAPAIGRFDIKPVVVTFAPGASSASVEITNTGPAPQELEVGVRSWTHSDAGDDGEATDDIVASPSIFIIAPGQTQLVRLGPAHDLTADNERTYRLVATEVPAASADASVQTILRMRLPVFVAPHATDAVPLAWRVARADPARLIITTNNTGNVHRRVRSLRVSVGSRVLFDEVVAAYVLAHQSRGWFVPFEAGNGAASVTVRATEMDGATEESSFSMR